MSSTSSIVETSIDLDMTPGAVMPVVNASQTDDLRLLTINLYANGTEYYLHHPSISHEELSMVLNGKKPDGNIFSYECEFDYDSSKVWAYFNKQMTAVAGEVLCELVIYAKSTEEENAEPRQVGSANFVLQVEESPTGGPDSESTLQSLDQIRHELGVAVVDSRQSASKAAESASKAAESAKNAAASANQALTFEQRATFSAGQAAKSEKNAAESEKNAAESEKNAAESEKNAALSASQAAESEKNATLSAGIATKSEQKAALSASQAAESEKNAALSASQAAESEKNAALSASQAAESEKNAALSANQALTFEQRATFSAGQAAKAEAAAKNWAVGPSGTGSGTDTNNSKYYSDQASAKYDAFVEATTPIIYKGTWYYDNKLTSKTHTFAEIYAMRDHLTRNNFHLYSDGPGDEEITCDYVLITSNMITLQFLYGFNVSATNQMYRIVIQHASDDTVTVNRGLLFTSTGLQNGIAEGECIDINDDGIISLGAPQYIVLREDSASGIEQTFSYTGSSSLDQFKTNFWIDPISVMELANDRYNVAKLAIGIMVHNDSSSPMNTYLDRVPLIDCIYSKPEEAVELSESIDLTFAFKDKFYRFLINIAYNNEFRSSKDVTKVSGMIQSVIPVTPGYGLSSDKHTLSVKLATESGLSFDSTNGLQAAVKDVQVQGDSIIDGNGTANIESMRGATSSSDGEIGLVPQPLSADVDKFLKGDGTWATPTGNTPIYPIEFDAVTSIPAKNIDGTALQATLAKNLPYSGDATSDKKWLDNLRIICDMSKTHYEALSKYVDVRLITDYADDSSYGKVGKKYNSMMEVDPTKVTISKWSTNKIYTMTGKCRFHYFDSADGNKYVDATWSYTVMYNSAKDTYSSESMKVSLAQYS